MVTLRLLRDNEADLTTTTPFEAGCRIFGLKGKRKVASLGYAGALAEMLSDKLYTHEEEAWHDINKYNMMSRSDTEMVERLISKTLRRQAMKRSLKLLKANWPEVMGMAFWMYKSPGFQDVFPHDLEAARWTGIGDFDGMWPPLSSEAAFGFASSSVSA